MTRSYVQYWEWFHAFGEKAAYLKDDERIRLYQLYSRGNNDAQKYPEQALALYREGVALARHLKEPWMELFYESGIVSTLLYKLYRYEEALDQAMKLVAKSNQKGYTNFPVQARIFLHLVAAYINLDKWSYIDEITSMIETLEHQVALDKDSYLRLFGYWAHIWYLRGDVEKALEATHLYVERSEQDAFRLTNGYEKLCHFSYLQGRDQSALEYAYQSLIYARRSSRTDMVVDAYWWQACLLVLRGDPQEAARCFRLGFAEASQLERPKDTGLWGGACRYYEIAEAYDKALLFWDEQVQLMNPQTPNRQDYFDIFLRRCFVLRKLGRLTQAHIEQTRQAALRMRKPDKYLAQIEPLHDGSIEIPRY